MIDRIRASFGPAGIAIVLIVVLLTGQTAFAAGVESSGPPGATSTLPLAQPAFSLIPEHTVDSPLSQQNFRLAANDDAPESAPAPPGRDWVGLGRDTALLLGYQILAIGALYLMPEEITNWSENEKKKGLSGWADNACCPVWDDDNWFINYVLHPYWGATYYIRARERGFDWLSSFAYSALASALYEFGLESIYERPSIQDLITTPVGGALLGAFVFEPIRNYIKAKPQLQWYDHVGLVATDPIGALNYVVERALGIKSTIRVGIKPPLVAQHERSGSRLRQAQRAQAFGMEITIPWP